MRATLREMRRAPVRVMVSIAAIALAIAAIGVFAVPGVAENSLRDIAAQDRLTHIDITTTPFDGLDALAGIDGFEAIEARTSGTVELDTGDTVLVMSNEADTQIDRLRVDDGRLPSAPSEALVSPGLATVGDILTVPGADPVTVVGIGQTTALATEDVVFALRATAQELTGIDGFNTILGRLDDPTSDKLDIAVTEIRERLTPEGVTFTTFPTTLPDGAHPIEESITQISFMIGSLGVVAGIVALILLASTANVIVTERTRDAAILRALGGTRRVVRRDLRRLAVTIGVIGTLVGIPLGIVVANIVARMVLERFAGISPSIGVAIPVMVASAVFGILGARLVSGRVARRVCKAELASALSDRDGSPFGARRFDRVLTKLPTGGLSQRIALRAVARRRARGLAVAAQFAGAVAAAVLVASLVTSIAGFNKSELASYNWDAATAPADPLYPYPLDQPVGPNAEVAIHTFGDVDGWEIELFGIDPRTEMVDTAVVAGSWLRDESTDNGAPAVVLAEKFAVQEGHAIGDDITVQLASGPATYHVVGLHSVRSVALFVAADDLAEDLGTNGSGNTVWTTGDASPPILDGLATTTTTRDALFAEDAAARDAVLAVFAAIGIIVVSIAALGAASTVAMNLYERRAEFATLQATGAKRRDMRMLVGIELGGLAAVGWAVGVLAGAAGASAIMGFFETANAVELGFTMAWAAVPITAAATLALVVLLSASAARQAQRQPLGVTLRAAT